MHFYGIVLINKPDNIEDKISKMLSPYRDEKFDWYKIGGRWTGQFDGYDPEKDINNIESCTLCNGTGKRTDMKVDNGCNGCRGRGVSVRWPTQWVRHLGDIKAVKELKLTKKIKPHLIVTEDYWISKDDMTEPIWWKIDDTKEQDKAIKENDKKWETKWKTIMEFNEDKIAVIVDFHD